MATKPEADGGNTLDFLSSPKNMVRQAAQKVASVGSDKQQTECSNNNNLGVIACLATTAEPLCSYPSVPCPKPSCQVRDWAYYIPCAVSVLPTGTVSLS